MTVTDIVDGINQKKRAIGMTNQQLSDASGVPKTTIDRVLRYETPNPSMQTILDLAAAVGYTISNHPEKPSPIPEQSKVSDPMTQYMISHYEQEIVTYEERLKRTLSHFNMLLAEKNRWLRFSLVMNIIFITFLVGLLVLDLFSPGVGWMKTISLR